MPLRPMLLHRMAHVSFRLFLKKFGQLARIFRANGSPPPHLQKIARTAMVVGGVGKNGNVLILLTPIFDFY